MLDNKKNQNLEDQKVNDDQSGMLGGESEETAEGDYNFEEDGTV